MKKIVSALLAVMILFTSVEAAIVVPPASLTTVNAAPQATVIATPRPAKKMNFFQKLVKKAAKPFASGKSQLTAVLLCFFIGGLGIHRFYLGYTWQGIVQLLTLGGFGIWTLIDFIRLLTGSLQPKNGEYEKTL